MKIGFFLKCVLSVFVIFNLIQKVPRDVKVLWTANWSHDGKYIAVGGDDKKIRIYDGDTFQLLKIHQHPSEVKRIRWHPTQNILAIAAVGNHSKMLNMETNALIELNGLQSIGSRAISWNHDGSLLALADFNGILTIWNSKGKPINTINKKGTYSYVGLDWHPKKNEIITLSEKVRVFNIDGTLLNTFKHRNEDILMLCVEWHKSGKFFIVGDYGNTDIQSKPLLQFWKADGTLIHQKDISKAEYRNISWNKKGIRLATASDALRIWSKKGKLLHTGLSEDYLWGIDWSPDGKYIITSSENGNIIVWDRKANIVERLNP